jgi:hypothetical protein
MVALVMGDAADVLKKSEGLIVTFEPPLTLNP